MKETNFISVYSMILQIILSRVKFGLLGFLMNFERLFIMFLISFSSVQNMWFKFITWAFVPWPTIFLFWSIFPISGSLSQTWCIYSLFLIGVPLCLLAFPLQDTLTIIKVISVPVYITKMFQSVFSIAIRNLIRTQNNVFHYCYMLLNYLIFPAK